MITLNEQQSSPVPSLLVLVGPTAVGKTALSLHLAETLDGEIVSADSRLFYRGMDIGTAKPTAEERARVPHHLIDIADPDETVGLAGFQEQAFEAIEQLQVLAIDEGRHRCQLSVPLERTAHVLIGGRVAQPQRTQLQAKLAQGDCADRRAGVFHAPTITTPPRKFPSGCVTSRPTKPKKNAVTFKLI